MKRSLAFLLVLSGLSASRLDADGKIRIEYVQSNNRDHRQIALDLKDVGLHESIAEAINAEIRLPRDIVVFFDSCGEANAFYDSESKSVIMCYELFELAASTFDEMELDEEEHAVAVIGVGGFFFLHEVGHALVDVLDIPTTGREEDAVDDLAAMLQFVAFSDEVEELAFWDEHSLDEQRFYSVACLIYGSDPGSYEFLVGDDGLPVERAERCREEFERKDRAWTALLAPHSRSK